METCDKHGYDGSSRWIRNGSAEMGLADSPGSRTRRRSPQAGFSLIEMCVVFALLGTIFAITLIGAAHLRRTSNLVGASNVLASDLRYARMVATTRGRSYQVNFQTSGYAVVGVSPQDTLVKRVYRSGVTGTSSGNPTFYSWGLTTPATITLSTSDASKAVRLAANGNISR